MKRALFVILMLCLVWWPLIAQQQHRTAHWSGTVGATWEAKTLRQTAGPTATSNFEVVNRDTSTVWCAASPSDTSNADTNGHEYKIQLRAGEGWPFWNQPSTTVIYVKSSSTAKVDIYRWQGGSSQ